VAQDRPLWRLYSVTEQGEMGGGCKGQFSRVVKWSCHVAITDALLRQQHTICGH